MKMICASKLVGWKAAAIYTCAIIGTAMGGMAPRTLVDDNTAFALDLYRQLKGETGNLFFSPYSISAALAMTYGGARHETAAGMEKALHFTLGAHKLHPAFSELNQRLAAIQKRGAVELCTANSLWPQKDYPFLPAYLDLLKSCYGSSSIPVDFKHALEPARHEINLWVEDKTRNRIRELIGPGMLEPLTRLVLVNAIYFKGSWSSRFTEEDTRDELFHAGPDQTVPVRMMVQTHSCRYAQVGHLQILELPYAGNDVVMRVLLPGPGTPLAAIEDQLTPAQLAQWFNALVNQKVRVCLPKFKITWGTFNLNRALQALGMGHAFSPQADFSGMDGTQHLQLSQVLHKAFVEVNEEGTEAAAATAVTMREKSASPSIVFYADRPFLFLICERQTGTLLFMGRVVAPQ